MLQRAASNAYTWWWASHIRTKQSKWLDNNLNDMEEKVKTMLKLIEEDADTFAKKAEMYYRRRPELIAFVEETYKSYRALAERYDHISGELHKANNTIATVFPDQVHFGMDEEEDDTSLKETTTDPPKSLIAKPPHQQDVSVDGAQPSLHKLQIHKRSASQASKQEEIDKLQKGILALQTEKEFVKSSYESGLSKYWDIEKRITEMQEKICSLQDGCGSATVIEDDEARALMAVTALKSCEDTLVDLHERQKKSSKEAKFESQRIKKARDKLRALKCRYGHMEADNQTDASTVEPSSTDESSGEEACDMKHDRLLSHSVCENVKRNFEMNPGMSVLDLAEKIDGLVNKVIHLETTVSSQSAQIQSLRVESDELQKHLHSLEEEKMHLIDGSKDLSEKLRQAEGELRRVQDLDKHVQDEGGKLKAHFTEAYNALSDLSDRLQTPRKTDDEVFRGDTEALKLYEGLQIEGNSAKNIDSNSELRSEDEVQRIVFSEQDLNSGTDMDITKVALLLQDKDSIVDVDPQGDSREHGDSSLPNWQQLFLDGLDDRERIFLTEYTSILRNYKDAKRKLMEAEKKNENHLFDTMAQMRDLKNANVMKDEEIHSLRLKLSFLETGLSDDGDINPRIPSIGNGEAPLSSASATGVPSSDADGNSHAADESPAVSSIEEKFRKDIDELLEENLEFWLRFSSSFQQIQKYKLLVQEIQSEIQKLRDSKKQEGGHHHHRSSSGGSNSSSSTVTSGEKPVRPEATAIHNQLKELQTDLSVWIEQNALLKQELQTRFASLCNIKEEIVQVSREGGEVQFTAYQAAKFQGEVLGMQQENNKVADELRAGLDHVKGLQAEAEKALAKLGESFEIVTSRGHQYHLRNLSYRTRIPLRSFLFGVKPKPKKLSIFSCMNPALQKQYSDLAYGIPQ